MALLPVTPTDLRTEGLALGKALYKRVLGGAGRGDPARKVTEGQCVYFPMGNGPFNKRLSNRSCIEGRKKK